MANKQIQKLHSTGNSVGDTVSGSIKITQPVRTMDVHIQNTPTNGATAPTLGNIAIYLGGLAMLKSIQMEGANGYSQHLNRAEILALAMLSEGSAWWNDFDDSTTSGVGSVTHCSVRLPLGLRVEYETLQVDIELEAEATLYTANAPSSTSVVVDVGFSHGPVVNEYRTWRYQETATTETQLTGLPNTGTLIGLFDIMDMDSDVDEGSYMVSRNHIEIKQDDQLVTQPEAYQMLQNFLALTKNTDSYKLMEGDASDIGLPPMGYIPLDLVLTDTETIYARQGSTTDTYDIVLVVAKPMTRQVPSKPYVSQTIDTNETTPSKPDVPVVDEGPSVGYVEGGGLIGGGFSIGMKPVQYSQGRIQLPTGSVVIKQG